MRPSLVRTLALGALALLAPGAHAQLVGPMEPMNPMIGTWEASGTWAWGGTLDARAEHTAGLNGHFMEITTWVSDNAQPEYLRYASTVSHDAEAGHHMVFSRQFNGQTTNNAWINDPDDGREAWATEFEMGGVSFYDEVEIIDENTLGWTVRMKRPGQEEWSVALSTEWKKVEMLDDKKTQTAPIDDALFEASGDNVRTLTKTREINAPAQEVYDAFATGTGVIKAMGREESPMVANIDQAIGGRYEWFFDGETGSNGCQTLCYIPGRLICFTWNAPPGQEKRGKRTWVAVQIESVDDNASRVTLSHAGFGEGEAWDETRDYFDKAWERVLDAYVTNLEK